MNPHVDPVISAVLDRYSASAWAPPHACHWCGEPTRRDSLCRDCEAEARAEAREEETQPLPS